MSQYEGESSLLQAFLEEDGRNTRSMIRSVGTLSDDGFSLLLGVATGA